MLPSQEETLTQNENNVSIRENNLGGHRTLGDSN